MIFIWPDNINDLSLDDAQKYTEAIRERRKRVGDSLANLKKAAGGISIGALKASIEKELSKFMKDVERADRALNSVERRLSNIAALRLQVGDKRDA